MSILKRLIFLMTGLLFAFIMWLLLFYAEKAHVYTVRILPYTNMRILGVGLIFTLILVFIIFLLKKKTEKILERSERWIIALLAVALLIYEFIFTYSSYFYTDWDPAGLLDAAEKIATGNTEDLSYGYLSAHPNNRFLIWIYYIIYKISIFFTGKCQVMAIIWIQCILTTICCVLVYRILRKLGNSAVFSFSVFAASSVYIGMSPWLDVPYSDEATLILPALILYIYVKREGMFSWMLIGLLTAVGYSIKPQVVITTIAVIIYSILLRISGRRKRDGEASVECMAGFVAAMMLFFLVLHGTIFPSLHLNLDVTQEFGVSHYFMMGLNPETDGVYSNDDTEFTASFENKHDRDEADIRLAKERIINYGPKGLAVHLIRKMIVNYGDGSFAWGINGNFFAGRPENMETPFTSFFAKIIYDGGVYFYKALSFAQGIWLIIIFGIIFTLIKVFKKEEESEIEHTDLLAIISLSLIGITVFEFTFEALSRYLFIYAPFYLLLGADGYRELSRLIRSVLKVRRQQL